MRKKSVSSIANRWLNQIYKVLAITLVLFAVLISGLRIILPYAQDYRQELQDHFNRNLGTNITLGAINFEWQQEGPLLVAEDVSILSNENLSVFIKKIDFHLDFWGSIRHQRIQTQNLNLQGAEIFINPFGITSSGSSNQDSSVVDSISELFLEQITKFSLNDSQIVLRRKETDHVFKIDELRWLNQGERHQANGSVILEGLTENTLKLQLDVFGDEVQNMHGQMYLEAQNLDITPWLGSTLSIKDEDTDTDINFQAWMNIAKGLPKSMNISLSESNVSYQYNQKDNRLQILDGDIYITNLDNIEKLNVESNAIELFTEDYAWQPFTFALQRTKNDEFAYISTLDLEGIKNILPLFLAQSDSLSTISALSATGELTDLYLRKLNDTWQATSKFSHISTLSYGAIPGIENLSGEFVFAKNNIQVTLLAEDGYLDFGQHFKQPLPYETLKVNVVALNHDKGWSLKFSDLSLNSSELTLIGDIGLELPTEGDASMALLTTVTQVEAENIPHYYPHLLMGEGLVNYLSQAVVLGKAEQAVVLFNGPLKGFPFKDNSGIFTVNAELIDATFSFDPLWPVIDGFNANLNFTNDSMLITGRAGTLQGIKVKGVEAAIASLSTERVLTIDADFNDALSSNVTRLMNNSSLSDTVGKTLEELMVSGLLNGQFNLMVPLRSPKDTVAQGQVYFEDNLVNLQTPEMNFTDVTGMLAFKNDVISTQDLTMKWQGLPLNMKVEAQNEAELYEVLLTIKALWQEKEWAMHLPAPLHKYVAGNTNLESDVRLNLYRNGDFTYEAKVVSWLQGLTLSLPAPYQKESADKKHLQAYAFGDKSSTTLDVSVDNNLSFYGVLDHNAAHFTKSHLVLGNDNILLPLAGFYISTHLDSIDFSQWQPFVFDIISATQSSEEADEIALSRQIDEAGEQPKTSILPVPEKIRGEIASLDVYGQKITDLSFDLADEKSWWKLILNAKEVRSEAKFYPDWLNDGVEVDADFIHLAWLGESLSSEDVIQATLENEAKTEKTSSQNTVNATQLEVTAKSENDKRAVIDSDLLFTNMPKLNVNCEQCKIGAGDLGKVSFIVSREGDDKLIVQNFKAKRGNSYLNFDLIWQHNNETSNTRIFGNAKVEDMEQELKRYNYPSTVRDSDLSAEYDLTWADAPTHFSLTSFNGDLAVELDDGYLAEVSDKGARIFSLLSLQSLVRKLTFDFRDIFSDGMFYSEIKGDFAINNGVLYTDNTQMKGAAGDLNVKGNTDLNKSLVDYRLSYKPNLTSSLPVLAWIATLNPVTFLAGVALDEVITSRVVSEFNFEVTGKLSDPILKEVDRKNKDVSVGRSSPPQIADVAAPVQEIETPVKNQSTEPVHTDNKPQVNKFNG